MERLKKEIGRANTVKGIKTRYEKWGEECAELMAQMTSRMDRARHSCRNMLQKHGVAAEERALGTFDVKSELPAFSRYISQEVQEVRVRGWFEKLEFWPKYETSFRQDVDRDKMLAGVEELLSERARFLNDHLSWWERRMREDYRDPLYKELEREEIALTDIRRAGAKAFASKKALSRLLQDVRVAELKIKNSVMKFFLLQKSEAPHEFSQPPDLCAFDEDSVFAWQEMEKAAGEEMENDAEQGIFAPLLTTFHEQNIQSRFLKLEALRFSRRIVFLGLRRHDSLRLLSRLAHDSALTDSLRTKDGRAIGERDWLFCGVTPPALPHVRIDTPDTLLRDLEVLVAPDDGLCDAETLRIDWGDIFAEWLPVIHLDIARIDSGLSDLARAPYAKALSYVDSWVAASGQGALFNGRLSDLLTDVPERVDLFARNRDCRGRVEWFVYENYDARYTDFMAWGCAGLKLENDGLLEKWAESGSSFKFPFSKPRLRLALEAARRKGAPRQTQDENT